MLTAEFLNHFPCETDMVTNYIFFKSYCVVTVKLTEVTKKLRTAESPRLALIIGDIFNLHTYFFHNFSAYSFLCCFTNLSESGNKRIIPISSSRIFSKKNSVLICNCNNNSRTYLRKYHILTAVTA